MFSTDFPVEGCFCCEDYEPVDETAGEEKGYDVYQTCVDQEISADDTEEKAKVAAAGGGKYQKCLNEINSARHNFHRDAHVVPLLNDFLKNNVDD